ncbi:MAG: chemotaxis protein CheA [candidate division WOR-3 bacterium]|nr:chemotaxis protein CheA [candidate division WOR-3 bacterium]
MLEEYLSLFISETESFVKQLEKELLNLERNNRNHNAILEVFRILHTIKGMAQTMGFEDLGRLSHLVEDLLAEPKKKGEIGKTTLEFLFIVVDYFSRFLKALKDKGSLPLADELCRICVEIKEGKEVSLERTSAVETEPTSIKIKMSKIDNLFNLANELLILKSRLSKLSSEIGNNELKNLSENAERLITSLQDEVMRLRMLPLSTVFDFFPRWLRDEAKKQNKEVDFEISGGDLEVDRSVIDVLKEPIMHLLRNALDHGIEKRGKITLAAFREKEFVRISVSDDGKGIDTEEIRKVAVERGLVDKDTARNLRDEELYKFLLRADFSTKKEVSTVSGRGIGLDIVNSSVKELGGRLEIKSEKGRGSTFTMELPISLAIIRAFILKIDGQRLALPLSYVRETFYIDEQSIQVVHNHELTRLRDNILSLVRLAERLNCVSKPGRKSVVVVEYEGRKRGFIVDEILGEEEIVVKKTDRLLPPKLYSGCSIYADGKPILILDPRGFE